MSYKNRLDKLKANWDSDKPASNSPQLPAGKYQFTIKRAFLEESKASFNKGNLCVVIEAHVLTGAFKGRKSFIRIDLEAKANIDKGWPSGISRFKGTLETLKLDMPKTLSDKDIEKTLKALINTCFNGTCVVNQKGYSNVYINDLLNAASEEDDDEEENEEDDDESEDDSDDDDEEDTEESDEDGEESDESESDEDEDDDDSSDDDEEEEDDEDEEEKKPPARKQDPKKSTEKPGTKPAKKEDDWENDFDDQK